MAFSAVKARDNLVFFIIYSFVIVSGPQMTLIRPWHLKISIQIMALTMLFARLTTTIKWSFVKIIY